MKFLKTDNYHDEISKLFRNDESLDIAVAFLGKDALHLFKLNPNKTIRVVCNFESGACNPKLVEKIMKYSNVEIRSNHSLHAKVLLQNGTMIIGSANLSANGLSLEGSELTAWKEAGLVIKDDCTIRDTKSWFDDLWIDSTLITLNDIDTQSVNWKKRRFTRPIKKSKESLIETAMTGNENMKDREIYFSIYRDYASDDALLAYKKVQSENEQISDIIDFYEGWSELPDNAYLISIYLGPRGGVEVDGIYQMPEEAMIKSFSTENNEIGEIKICFKKTNILGYKLTNKDKLLIRKNIEFLRKHRNFKQDEACLIPLFDWAEMVSKGI